MAGIGRVPSAWAAPEAKASSADGLGPGRVGRLQRARMLGAMAEVCAERGAANVTVAQIVSRSGVSRRTFYEQFEDREACFLATLEEAVACAAGSVCAVYDAPARWHERMRSVLVAFLSFLEDEPFLGRVLVVESVGAGTVALERRKHALRVVTAAVDEGRSVVKGRRDLPPLTAEGLVGGVLSVIHTRLLEPSDHSLLELTGPLMSMIVLPYLGRAAADGELRRPAPVARDRRVRPPADLLRDVEMRLTYRTARVLTAVASHPGSSNREIGLASGIEDQGQISKLLTRLAGLGLIANTGAGRARGAPNAWALTDKGAEIEWAISKETNITSPPASRAILY